MSQHTHSHCVAHIGIAHMYLGFVFFLLVVGWKSKVNAPGSYVLVFSF